MVSINTKVRKWGNSFGIVLPKKIVERDNIQEGLDITITIEPSNKTDVGDLFNLSKKNNFKSKKHVERLIKDVDDELWSEK